MFNIHVVIDEYSFSKYYTYMFNQGVISSFHLHLLCFNLPIRCLFQNRISFLTGRKICGWDAMRENKSVVPLLETPNNKAYGKHRILERDASLEIIYRNLDKEGFYK